MRTTRKAIVDAARRGVGVILFAAFLAVWIPGRLGQRFTYRSDSKLGAVNVAGSFNGWNKDATSLKTNDGGFTWTVDLQLTPGKYAYKFVLNGNKWITDPKALRNEDDGNGNTNSICIVVPSDYAKPAAKGDGAIATSALKHLSEVPFFNYDRGRLSLVLQTRPNDISHVELVVGGSNRYLMADQGGDEIYERYLARVPWSRKTNLRYHFVLNDGAGDMVFGPRGLTKGVNGNDFLVSAAAYHPFVVPSWVERSVIYQIFPDRFADGDKANDPARVMPWDAKPNLHDYFGGDVAGVEQHMGYLKSLGVSAIYFNPVFKSPVYHRYETADYLQIDPAFGANDEFEKLTRDLKQNGIRTILDGVFNHTATSFAPFADVKRNGAASPYRDWYSFKSFPVRVGRNPNYVAWNNSPSMPKVNYGCAAATNYMLGVPTYWQSHADIAGWRLDAANEVDSNFWRAFRKRVKSIDPNTWIVGEVWDDGSQWLKGDEWDSVMNYPFRQAVLNFVTKPDGRPSSLIRDLMANYNRYAPQVSRNMMNLIGSHDTERIMTLCNGDRALAKLAAIIQFTWVGTPSIYYGDELGMTGARDPDNRRGMTWGAATPSNDLLSLYKTLIRTRNTNSLLQSGDPLPLLTDDEKQVVSFARVLDGKADIVAVNRSERQQTIDLQLGAIVGLPKSSVAIEFNDAITGAAIRPSKGILHLRLSPKSAAVLIPRSGSLTTNPRHIRRSLVGASLATSKELHIKEPS